MVNKRDKNMVGMENIGDMIKHGIYEKVGVEIEI